MKNIYFYINYKKIIIKVFGENHIPEKIALADETNVDFFEHEHNIDFVGIMIKSKLDGNFNSSFHDLFLKFINNSLKDVGALNTDNVNMVLDLDSEIIDKIKDLASFSYYKLNFISIFEVFEKYSLWVPSFNGVNFNFDFSSLGPNDKKIVGGGFWEILNKIRIEYFADSGANDENNEHIFNKCYEKYRELLNNRDNQNNKDVMDDITHLLILKTLAKSENYKGKTIYKSGIIDCFPLNKSDFLDNNELKEFSELFKRYALEAENCIILEAEKKQAEILKLKLEEQHRQKIEEQRLEDERKARISEKPELIEPQGENSEKQPDQITQKEYIQQFPIKLANNFLKFIFTLLLIAVPHYLILVPGLFEPFEINSLQFQCYGLMAGALIVILGISWTNKSLFRFIYAIAVCLVCFYIYPIYFVKYYYSAGYDIPFESTFWLTAIAFFSAIMPLILVQRYYLKICKNVLITIINNFFSITSIILIYVIISCSILEFSPALESLAIYRSQKANEEMLKKIVVNAGMFYFMGAYAPGVLRALNNVNSIKSKVELFLKFLELTKKISQIDNDKSLVNVERIINSGKNISQLKNYISNFENLIVKYQNLAAEINGLNDSVKKSVAVSRLSDLHNTIIKEKYDVLQAEIASIISDKAKIETELNKLIEKNNKQKIADLNTAENYLTKDTASVQLNNAQNKLELKLKETSEVFVNDKVTLKNNNITGENQIVDLANDTASVWFNAARNNNTSEMQLLLSKKVNVNLQNKEGMSALMIAVESNCVEIVNLLLDKSDINICNYNNINALGIAIAQNNIKLVKLLIETGGAPVNCFLNKDNQTPLMLAIGQNQIEIADYLLQKGASLTAANQYGWTPLAYAVYKKNWELVNLLINKKWEPPSDVNAKVGECSILMMAVNYDCNDRIINGLLNNGADVEIKNEKGLTAIDIAKSKKDNKIYNLIKNYKRK